MLLVKHLQLPNGKIASIRIKKNQGYLLQGENGAGKSLLLKSLAYLIPAKHDKFIFADRNIQDWMPEEFRSKVMYCGGQVSNNSTQTTEDFLNFPFTFKIYKDLSPSIDTQHWLKTWSINNQLVSKLSSGQKQLLNFLRVLSLGADILLLDEVFSNLDAKKSETLIELLKEWQKKTQGSFVIVTHSELQVASLDLVKIQFSDLKID
jgi:putative ABC transport system ATP-binding protein